MSAGILHSVQHSATTLQCRMVSSSEVHLALASWRELERRLGSRSVASGATWTETWLEVYGNTIDYRFFLAEEGGQPRGICLLVSSQHQKLGPCAIQTLHLGTAGERQPGSVCVEYNRILVEPQYQLEFFDQLYRHVQRDPHWEQFRIDGFSSTELEAWQSRFPDAEIQSRESRYFNLKDAREEGACVIDRLGKSTRSNLRRRLKQYGDLQCEWAHSIEQVEDILSELIQLHQARWNAVGLPGAFASEHFLRFQTAASTKLFLEQKLVLFRVRHEGETVGCLLLLVDENRLLDYLSGFADFDVKPSPGLTTHYLCMEEALRRGFDAYDFLVGDKRHKDNLSSDVNSLCWLTCTRPSFRLRTISMLRAFKQAFSRKRAMSSSAE